MSGCCVCFPVSAKSILSLLLPAAWSLVPHRKPRSSVSFEAGAWMAQCQSPGRGWNQDRPAHLAGSARDQIRVGVWLVFLAAGCGLERSCSPRALEPFRVPQLLAGLGGRPAPGGGVCMKRCASVLLSYICSSNVLSILLHPALCPRKLNCMDRLPSHPSSPRLLAGRVPWWGVVSWDATNGASADQRREGSELRTVIPPAPSL